MCGRPESPLNSHRSEKFMDSGDNRQEGPPNCASDVSKFLICCQNAECSIRSLRKDHQGSDSADMPVYLFQQAVFVHPEMIRIDGPY